MTPTERPGKVVQNVLEGKVHVRLQNGSWEWVQIGLGREATFVVADAILDALDQAGYAVIPKGTFVRFVVDPTMPDDEIEIRSDVDSVRITNIG